VSFTSFLERGFIHLYMRSFQFNYFLSYSLELVCTIAKQSILSTSTLVETLISVYFICYLEPDPCDVKFWM
jgi:hypothetical protein